MVEGDYYGNTLIAYGEMDVEMADKRVTKKRYYLFIDLWLFHLKFDWTRKVRYES